MSEALEFMYLNIEMGELFQDGNYLSGRVELMQLGISQPRIFDGIYDIFTALLTVE